MKQIAYLASTVTLPGSPTRRTDAYEHDLMMDALTPAFAVHDMQITAIAWDDPTANWTSYDGAIIGTTWDYWDRQAQFLATLDKIEETTPLMNSAKLVRWNSHKGYLRELEDKGANLIPTLWLDKAAGAMAEEAFKILGSNDLVFKRQVGAGADGQHRLKRGDAIPPMPQPMMVQPFMPMIQTEGEISFVFIDGELSHTLIKRAKPGDYRIQSTYGGTEEKIEPTEDDKSAARAILTMLDTTPLYARVDMLRDNKRGLLLMELELIEPYLYPVQGPALGTLMASAVAKRL